MANATPTSLPKQIVQVELTAGLNRKRDAHQLQNGELLTADNVVYSAVDGQVTKRFGYKQVQPQGAPFQGGPFKAIGCRDDIEPLVLGQNTLNRYNTNQNLSTSLPLPTQGRLAVQPVVGSTGKTTFPWPPSHAHVAIDDSGKYACVVWEEPNTDGSLLFYGVQDQTNGAWIISPQVMPHFIENSTVYLFKGYQQPQVNYSNGYFFVSFIWNGVASGTYDAMVIVNTIALNNLAAGFTYTGSFLDLSGFYDIVQNSNSVQLLVSTSITYDIQIANGRFIVAAFGDGSTTRQTTIKYWLGTVADRKLTTTKTDTFVLPALSNQSTNAYNYLRVSAKCNGPATKPFVIATAVAVYLISNAGIVTFYNLQQTFQNQYYGSSPVDVFFNGNQLCFTSYGADGASPGCMYLYCTDLLFNNAKQVRIQSPVGSYLIEQLSRLFVLPSGRVAFWLGSGSNTSDTSYNSAYLVEVDTTQVTPGAKTIARTLYQSNYKLDYSDKTTPCEVFQVAGTSQFVTYLTAGTEKAAAVGNTQTWRAYGTLNRVTFDYAPARQVQVVPLAPGGNLIAGAYPLYYDGNEVVEAGFSAAPDYTLAQGGNGQYGQAGLPQANTTDGSMAAATYTYLCCFARRDAYGNVTRSAPSAPIAVTISSGTSGNVTFRSMYYGGGGNVVIEYYRNTPTLAGQGTYYFVGSVAPLTATQTNITYFVDRAADANITSSRSFNQSETPCDPPPAIYHMATSDTRAYLIPADNRNQVWASKLYSPGRTVEWNSSQYVTEGQNAGLFTGIAVLDANVIVFKADSICYFYGSGPDNSGSGGGFAPLQKLATDVGCIDAASIKVTPDGVVFRSRRGIELLTRSLQIVYIGNNVEPLVQAMGPLSSVVLMPNYTELRFVPATPGQPVLVFDYGQKRWSTFGEKASGLSTWASVQAVSIQGAYWWIAADGSTVNVETPGSYLDAGQPVVMTLETAEVPVGGNGPQGWGRLYRMALLGDFYTDHKLTVSFAYDHQRAYTDAVVFDTKVGLITGDTVYQFRCSRTPRQRMQVVRFKFQDSVISGQSCAISSLALELANKGGLARLPAAKTL